jgi:hypothetical protein
MHLEPVVRVRSPSPEDRERCLAVLRGAGLEPGDSLGWLVVREASPDAVNDLLVAGGTLGRAVAREQVGRLLAYLLDHPDLAGRGASLLQLVRRALSEAGLQARWAPRPEAELLAAGAALREHLLATGGAFVPWERFVADWCLARPPA